MKNVHVRVEEQLNRKLRAFQANQFWSMMALLRRSREFLIHLALFSHHLICFVSPII